MLRKLQNATDTVGELFLYYALLVLGAASSFSYFESIPIGKAIYWAVITTTSVGFGDISPKTGMGMVTACIAAILSILVILPLLIAQMYAKLHPNKHEFTDDEQQYVLDTMKMVRERLVPPPQQQQQQPPSNNNGLEARAPESESFFKPKAKSNG
jgi:voltage-gated potassium channel